MDPDDEDSSDYALFEGGGGWIFKRMVGEHSKEAFAMFEDIGDLDF